MGATTARLQAWHRPGIKWYFADDGWFATNKSTTSARLGEMPEEESAQRLVVEKRRAACQTVPSFHMTRQRKFNAQRGFEDLCKANVLRTMNSLNLSGQFQRNKRHSRRQQLMMFALAMPHHLHVAPPDVNASHNKTSYRRHIDENGTPQLHAIIVDTYILLLTIK